MLATPAKQGFAIVASNQRDPRVSDVYQVELTTGALKLIAKNPGDVTVWGISDAGRVVATSAVTKNGTLELRTPTGPGSTWRTVYKARVSERFTLLVFHGGNDPRVRTEQALRVMRAWHDRQLPATLLLADNEGHSFNEESTSLAVHRAVELFLAKWLGGRSQQTVEPSVSVALERLRMAGDTLEGRKH